MRLLNVHTFELHTFYGDSTPPYAILSHTWLNDYEEVTFAQLQLDPHWRDILGARKIEYLCSQAARHGHAWAWIDTCCIDKTNSSELAEAINSMFKWYQKAEICYVYLMDMNHEQGQDYLNSRWWSRAWTLQELVAPANVEFYDTNWLMIGTKASMAASIANTKNIDIETLHNAKIVYSKSVAQRMSWAARREATREEDLAYSLLGIFNINMPMQYGEGERAFVRLQEEITRTTNDMSIFAWGFASQPLEHVYREHINRRPIPLDLGIIDRHCGGHGLGAVARHGLYATRPHDFSQSQDIVHLAPLIDDSGLEERQGVQILRTHMIHSRKWKDPSKLFDPHKDWALALLPCVLSSDPHCLVGILLRRWYREPQRTMRHAFIHEVYSCLIRSEHIPKANPGTLKVDLYDASHLSRHAARSPFNQTLIVKLKNIDQYPCQVLEPTLWLLDEHDCNRFTMDQDPSQLSHTIVRFHNPASSVDVHVEFQIPTADHRKQPMKSETIKSVLTAVPSGAASNLRAKFIFGSINRLRDSEAVGPRTGCKLICGHDRLFAKVTTTIVFNQVLITLTLEKWKGAWVYRREENLQERSLCLKPEEWQGR